jgi:hypothetical protein
MHYLHLNSMLTPLSKPELTNVKLPPIRQVTPEQRFTYSSSITNYDSDMSRRPSVSSIASSGFHPSRSASPTFSTSTFEPQYGSSRSLDRLRMQAGHVQSFPYTSPVQDSRAATPHTGGKASKKKRDDRKQYSKRAATGNTSSRVQKSDNEAGNRYDQALDQAKLVEVCKQGNPRLETTAAPRSGGKFGWTPLKNNNVNWDVLKDDGIQPSLWNKACVNGSAILMIKHSNAQLDDTVCFLTRIRERGTDTTTEQLLEQLLQYEQSLRATKDTRGEADWLPASERLAQDKVSRV